MPENKIDSDHFFSDTSGRLLFTPHSLVPRMGHAQIPAFGKKHRYRKSADLRHNAEDFRYDSVFRRVASNADRDLVQQQIFEWDYLSIFYNFSNVCLKVD